MAELWQLVPKRTLHHLSSILYVLCLQLKIQSNSVEAGGVGQKQKTYFLCEVKQVTCEKCNRFAKGIHPPFILMEKFLIALNILLDL